MRTTKEELLLEEFRQAWEHYRHIEKTRSWATGFLYTVALAAFGGVLMLFKEAKPSSDAYSVSLVMVFLVGSLGLAVRARVQKETLVLDHYLRAWRYVRQRIYTIEFDELDRNLHVDKHSLIKQFYPGEIETTNFMVWLVVVVAWVYLALGVIHGWSNFEPTKGQQVLALLLLTFLSVFAWLVFVKVRHAKIESQKAEKKGSSNSSPT